MFSRTSAAAFRGAPKAQSSGEGGDYVSQCQQWMRRAVANKTSVSAVLLPQGAITLQSPDVIAYKLIPEIMSEETPF